MAMERRRMRRPTPGRRTLLVLQLPKAHRQSSGAHSDFGLLRVLPLGACLVGGYALSFYGWNNAWMPTAYVAFALGIVLAQGFLLPDRDAGLREFFWVSLFFLLTTPLLQFGPIRMDHYNFHAIGSLAGTQIPYVLALLVNLVIASAAGLAFQLLWKWQYSGDKGGSSALTRAASVALPPVLAVYAAVVVITNISVSIQLAVLLPVLASVLTGLLVLRDPAVNPNERDRQFLLWTVTVGGNSFEHRGNGRHHGDIPVAGYAERPAGPQPAAFLGDRFRPAGLYPGGGAGPAEPGIRLARHLGLCLHGLRCRGQVDHFHLPD